MEWNRLYEGPSSFNRACRFTTAHIHHTINIYTHKYYTKWTVTSYLCIESGLYQYTNFIKLMVVKRSTNVTCADLLAWWTIIVHNI